MDEKEYLNARLNTEIFERVLPGGSKVLMARQWVSGTPDKSCAEIVLTRAEKAVFAAQIAEFYAAKTPPAVAALAAAAPAPEPTPELPPEVKTPDFLQPRRGKARKAVTNGADAS